MTQLDGHHHSSRQSTGCVVLLPGGFVDTTETVHTEAELSPLTGKDEELLGALPPDTPMARVVTELLSRCLKRIGSLQPVTEPIVRDLLVEDRAYLVMKLRELTLGKQVEAVFYCPGTDCEKPMDVTFSLDDVPVQRAPQTARLFSCRLSSGTGGGTENSAGDIVEFRLPTGGDQEAVVETGRMDEERAAKALLARCIRTIGAQTTVDQATIAALSPTSLREIEEAMRQHAPNVDIEPETICPECGREFLASFDMASFFMAELQADQRRLEREVHVIARNYHWSEQDILSLPTRKRRRYLHMLREEFEAYAEG